MSAIDYSEKIPNNVNLSEDRALQRALEHWQPNYLQWWQEMGPEGSQNFDEYLRTAINTTPEGWAQFGHVKMPDYRWGIFLNAPEADRKVNFGEHKGEDAWQEVPGEHRANLRRIIVTQGDTEPASVEQQRRRAMRVGAPVAERDAKQMRLPRGVHPRRARSVREKALVALVGVPRLLKHLSREADFQRLKKLQNARVARGVDDLRKPA